MQDIKKIYRFVIAAIGGSLYALAFPTKIGFFFFPGQIIGLTLLLAILIQPNPKISLKSLLILNILLGLAFSFGYYQTGYYWIPFTIQEFGNLHPPLNYIVGILFVLVIMPHLTFFICIDSFLKKRFYQSKFIRPITVSATIFTLLEYFIPQQFPAHLGHPWMHLAPHLGLAPIFGYSVYSFISALFAFAIAKFVLERKLDFFGIFTATILSVLSFTISLPENKIETKKTTAVRMVQANIGNFMKVNSERGDDTSLKEIYQRYYNLSTHGNNLGENNFKPELIIWPETAFPEFINSSLATSDQLYTPTLLREIVNQTGAELFTGGYEEAKSFDGSDFNSQYNAAFLISARGVLKDYYYKIKLIPFGEGLPFGPLNRWLSNIITNISYFASGDRFPLFETKNGVNFFSLICYEVLFPSFVRDYLNRLEGNPSFLINLTNDSWYGNTSEPFQHLFLAKWRAVEFNIPMARMTNTGITSVIYPDGHESDRIKYGDTGALDLELVTYERKITLFQKFGIINFLLLATITILVSLLKIPLLKDRADV